jgi:putative MFS transporter
MGRGDATVSVLDDARQHLSKADWFLLWVLGATSFFDGFDRGIIQLALPQIRDTFGLTQSSASLWLSVVYLGALPALFITRWADKIGRRKLLMISIVGYTISTGLTAIAPNAAAFVACQFVARLFLNAESAIVWTMAAEELPAKARGFGFGWLAMNAALGVGLGAILYGGVFDAAGISWRWLYVVGLPPLIGIGFLRRRLPESRRFLAARDEGRLVERWHEITRPPHRQWLVLLVVTSVLIELTTQAGAFTIDFLQTDRGISTAASNFMLVAAGLPGIPIMIWAGALSDRYGRRVIGVGFSLMSFVGAIGLFWMPGGIPILLPCMMLTIVGQLGAWPAIGGYASELFPTPLRGQAASWATVARVVGQSGSFALGGALLAATDSFPVTVTLLGIGPVLAVIIIAKSFPETHGRELEDISGEEAGTLPLASVAL